MMTGTGYAEHYDIALIGLGPAGSTFARLAAKHQKIIAVDRDCGEGEKPCGGLLSPDAQKALAQFDLSLPKEVLVDPQIFTVKTIDLRSKLIRRYQRFYINVDRQKFDRWLLSMVEGVRICRGTCTGLKRVPEGFEITWREKYGSMHTATATRLVGADGANSLVRRTFFPKKKLRAYMAIQQHFSESHKSPFYSCIFDPDTSDCCSWSISKDSRFIFGGAFALQNCRVNFQRQKDKLEGMGFSFGDPLKTQACLVLRPRSVFDICPGGDGVILLGEAAGMISPSSLEGISWAVRSARILSEVYASGKRDIFSAYNRKLFPLRIKLALKLMKCPLMYKPLLRRAVMKSGLRTVKIVSGDEPPFSQ